MTKKKARTGGARAKKEFIINKIVKLRLGNTTIKDYSTKNKACSKLCFYLCNGKKESPYRYGLIPIKERVNYSMKNIKPIMENFTKLDNRIVRLPNLSFGAKGLYCYMASMSHEWKFSLNQISKDCGVKLVHVTKYLNELFEVGLVAREVDYTQTRGRKYSYIINGYECLKGSNHAFSNLENSNLENSNLERSNLENSKLETSNLENSNIETSNIEIANTIEDNINKKKIIKEENSFKEDKARAREKAPATFNAPAVVGAPTKEPQTPKTQNHAYGQYKNVMLSDQEFETLKSEYPMDYQKRIEAVSEYCASHGKSYKNYLATIRVWAKKDKEKQANQQFPQFQQPQFRPASSLSLEDRVQMYMDEDLNNDIFGGR